MSEFQNRSIQEYSQPNIGGKIRVFSLDRRRITQKRTSHLDLLPETAPNTSEKADVPDFAINWNQKFDVSLDGMLLSDTTCLKAFDLTTVVRSELAELNSSYYFFSFNVLSRQIRIAGVKIKVFIFVVSDRRVPHRARGSNIRVKLANIY